MSLAFAAPLLLLAVLVLLLLLARGRSGARATKRRSHPHLSRVRYWDEDDEQRRLEDERRSADELRRSETPLADDMRGPPHTPQTVFASASPRDDQS